VLFRRFVSLRACRSQASPRPDELLSPRVKQRILSMRHRALETRVGGPISSILRSYGPVLPMQLMARIGMRRVERRGRNREEEIMIVRDFRLAALVVFLMRSVSSTAAAGSTISLRGQHAAVARQFVSDNDSMGVGATIQPLLCPGRPSDKSGRRRYSSSITRRDRAAQASIARTTYGASLPFRTILQSRMQVCGKQLKRLSGRIWRLCNRYDC
jgi:hypothetical protein